MTKNTESLISACHELARVASCDDYLILNEIADKLKFLRKERDSYKEMFYESCLGLGAIACAAGIKEENDSGSPGQVIDKINSMLNIDWNFNSHPDIKVGEEMKCWAYVRRTVKQLDFVGQDENGQAQYFYKAPQIHEYVTVLNYLNKPTPDEEHIDTWDYEEDGDIPEWSVYNDAIAWVHAVGWHEEYSHYEYNSYYEEIDKNIQVLAWAEFIHPAAPEVNNE
ncbi:hypothetical protein [Photorhabdus hindustanensis]|uniref:hypothetical protein n=1 Tax=Photorhabdus hindustanensis TaxID=2918802 RepID=UPI0015E34D05|nr:hypothetical protein [Photorhabdus hindustanensis]